MSDRTTETADPASIYKGEFYEERRARTLESARRVLGVVEAEVPFSSIADIGCGTGTWLSVALQGGVTRAVGLEGNWVRNDMLDDPRIEFHSPERARTFVQDLCRTAPYVLFGAAIPLQGGSNHLNEQWQSYWAALFQEQGYRAWDLVRPQVWAESDIPVWYRQNVLLYVAEDVAGRHEVKAPTVLDIVHPYLWSRERKRRLRTRISDALYVRATSIAGRVTGLLKSRSTS